jgi:predicted nicotinamide N-methyase
MPSMIRAFELPMSEGRTATVELHEPSLTSDNLGFKTWTSSVLLSKRLSSLQRYLPRSQSRVLELGAGTGLVGIAAACIWGASVTLTDLPEILPNLQKNIDRNSEAVQAYGGNAVALTLDWSDRRNVSIDDDDRYSTIVAADPLYSPDHPQILVDTVHRFLRRTPAARFIVELPLRDGYQKEREELKSRLIAIGLDVVHEGHEFGIEDWQGRSGEQTEVECWWSIWQYKASALIL